MSEAQWFLAIFTDTSILLLTKIGQFGLNACAKMFVPGNTKLSITYGLHKFDACR